MQVNKQWRRKYKKINFDILLELTDCNYTNEKSSPPAECPKTSCYCSI